MVPPASERKGTRGRADTCDRGRGPRQALRRHEGGRRRRPVGPQGQRLRGPGPQRRRQDDHDPDAGDAHPPRRRQRTRDGPRHRRGPRGGSQARQPDGPARIRGRGPDGPREPDPHRASARHEVERCGRARRRAARGVRHRRGLRAPRQELLGRDAPPPRHRREHRRHARADVPRRADDGPRPAVAQPGLGHDPRLRRGGDDDPALHAVPRGGRPALRGDRGDRPRQGDRRGHPVAAQGLGRLRGAQGAACSTPTQRPEAERLLAASSARSPSRPTPPP